MNVRHLAILAVPLALLVPAGCQKVATSSDTPEDRNVAITIADSGCTTDRAEIPAGPATFKVTNKDAKVVNEAELVNADGRILGERENLTPGLSASFSLNLDAGDYTIYCPGAETESAAFKVTGEAKAASQPPSEVGDQLEQGVAGYADYVKAQTGQLVTATKAFTDAVRAGDLDKSKELYGQARVYYERIEPVAESFGDLDPAIDARANDVEDPTKWTGFHPIEQSLWEKKTAADLTKLADQLDADVTKLDGLVQTTTYQPADLANGATTLLAEVASSKITGEEERYSHLDLLDFWANVDGAKRSFDLLTPALKRIDGQLVTTVNERFTDVNHALAQYRDGNSFKLYTDLTKPQIKELADKVDALAEPLSKVAEKVVSFK
ncbi:iron uptake system protein EfeO [Tenggerimyces flavus]|uniref:Iron uptake system protein EfeO n=1 Tax=Tenggerimyces flavus TaxID=1708749 RepID=A0ABV7YHX4_9ACTN|nr:iron uptake system protein EfeO [Tenggerimyces flavus]MBM7789193.1 iron uptake system component EfeO [Tenggerimyces flavus]